MIDISLYMVFLFGPPILIAYLIYSMCNTILTNTDFKKLYMIQGTVLLFLLNYVMYAYETVAFVVLLKLLVVLPVVPIVQGLSFYYIYTRRIEIRKNARKNFETEIDLKMRFGSYAKVQKMDANIDDLTNL